MRGIGGSAAAMHTVCLRCVCVRRQGACVQRLRSRRTPIVAPHHSVSLTDLKASSASSLANAEATRLVQATLSQKKR